MKNILDLIVVIGLPIFSYTILKKNSGKLEDEEFKAKFGSLYGNLNPEKSSAISFTTIFCLHRIVIATSSVWL